MSEKPEKEKKEKSKKEKKDKGEKSPATNVDVDEAQYPATVKGGSTKYARVQHEGMICYSLKDHPDLAEHRWKAKFDTNKSRLFFTCLADKSKKVWKLPEVDASTLPAASPKDKKEKKDKAEKEKKEKAKKEKKEKADSTSVGLTAGDAASPFSIPTRTSGGGGEEDPFLSPGGGGGGEDEPSYGGIGAYGSSGGGDVDGAVGGGPSLGNPFSIPSDAHPGGLMMPSETSPDAPSRGEPDNEQEEEIDLDALHDSIAAERAAAISGDVSTGLLGPPNAHKLEGKIDDDDLGPEFEVVRPTFDSQQPPMTNNNGDEFETVDAANVVNGAITPTAEGPTVVPPVATSKAERDGSASDSSSPRARAHSGGKPRGLDRLRELGYSTEDIQQFKDKHFGGGVARREGSAGSTTSESDSEVGSPPRWPAAKEDAQWADAYANQRKKEEAHNVLERSASEVSSSVVSAPLGGEVMKTAPRTSALEKAKQIEEEARLRAKREEEERQEELRQKVLAEQQEREAAEAKRKEEEEAERRRKEAEEAKLAAEAEAQAQAEREERRKQEEERIEAERVERENREMERRAADQLIEDLRTEAQREVAAVNPEALINECAIGISNDELDVRAGVQREEGVARQAIPNLPRPETQQPGVIQSFEQESSDRDVLAAFRQEYYNLYSEQHFPAIAEGFIEAIIDCICQHYIGRTDELFTAMSVSYGPESPLWAPAWVNRVNPIDERWKIPVADRLYAFYLKYNPSKASPENVSKVMTVFKGNTKELFNSLVERYGPEPTASEIFSSLIRERDEEKAAPTSAEEDHTMEGEQHPTEVNNDPQAMNGLEGQPKQSSDDESEKRERLREKLVAFYSNAVEAHQVNERVEKAMSLNVTEEELWEALYRKYEREPKEDRQQPTVTAVTTTSPPKLTASSIATTQIAQGVETVGPSTEMLKLETQAVDTFMLEFSSFSVSMVGLYGQFANSAPAARSPPRAAPATAPPQETTTTKVDTYYAELEEKRRLIEQLQRDSSMSPPRADEDQQAQLNSGEPQVSSQPQPSVDLASVEQAATQQQLRQEAPILASRPAAETPTHEASPAHQETKERTNSLRSPTPPAAAENLQPNHQGNPTIGATAATPFTSNSSSLNANGSAGRGPMETDLSLRRLEPSYGQHQGGGLQSSTPAADLRSSSAPKSSYATQMWLQRGPIKTPVRLDAVSHSGANGGSLQRGGVGSGAPHDQHHPQNTAAASPSYQVNNSNTNSSSHGLVDDSPSYEQYQQHQQRHVTPARPLDMSASPAAVRPDTTPTGATTAERERGGGATAFLQWDTKRSGPCILSSNGTVALAERSQIYSTHSSTGRRFKDPNLLSLYTIGTIGIARGELVFEVIVDLNPLSVGSFCVGVASKYFRGPQGKKCPAYLLRSDGFILPQSDGSQVVRYTSPFPSGSKVTIHLDMNRWELSFYINGSNCGVAFRFTPIEDPEPLFPVVVFSGDGDSATLQPPTADTLPSHVSPRRHGKSKSRGVGTLEGASPEGGAALPTSTQFVNTAAGPGATPPQPSPLVDYHVNPQQLL